MKLPNFSSPDWLTLGLMAMSFYVITLSVFVDGTPNNPLFRTLAQAIVITGLIGIALAYHYRSDQQKSAEIARLRAEIEELRAALERARRRREE